MTHARKQRSSLLFGSFGLMLVVACGRVLGTDFDNLYPAQAGAGGAGMGGGGNAGYGGDNAGYGGTETGGAGSSSTGGSSTGGSSTGGSSTGGSSAGALGEGGVGGGPSCSPDATDFYVNPAAVPGDCEYPTITAALDAAHLSRANGRTVHVAEGHYDAVSNEKFPLRVTGGISLVGAGASKTVIEGMDSFATIDDGGAWGTSANKATIVTGDKSAVTRIANLRLLSGTQSITQNSSAIFCNRGNGQPPGAPRLEPTLIVDGVTFDAQYDQSLAVTNSMMPEASACNVRVISSTFRNSANGIANNACGGTDDTDTYSSLEIGDGNAAHANLFDNLAADGLCAGDAVRIWGCSSWTSIRGNLFNRGERAVTLAYGGQPDQYVEIIGNTFKSQADGSLQVLISAQVDELSSNQFTLDDALGFECNVQDVGRPSAAIRLWDYGRNTSPRIAHARNNSFIGNRVAVRFEGNTEFDPSDFGTVDDPGGNTFSCNSNVDGFGFDVRQSAHTAADKRMLFAGNYWDHSIPTLSTSESNGLDYWLDSSGPAPLLDNAKLANTTCPKNFTKGP